MMRIGITESTYNIYPKEDRYRLMKADGYDCIDYGMSNLKAEPYTLAPEEFDAFYAKERAMAEAAGLTISQVHGPWAWPPSGTYTETREEWVDIMKRSIRATALLGCQNWVLHPFMPYGIDDRDTENSPKTWELNVSVIRELLPYAKKHGVYICYENMPMRNFTIGSVDAIMRVVREIDDDHLRVCLDTGHVNVFEGQTLYDAVHKVADKLQVLHVHDNNEHYDEHRIPWFGGTADWDGFGRALREIGFDGVFSFETGPSRTLPAPLYGEMLRFIVKCGHTIMQNGGSKA